MVKLHATVIGVAASLGEAVFFQNYAESQTEASLSSVATSEVAAFLGAFAETSLSRETPANIPEAMNAITSHMDVQAASKALNTHKLPEDVTKLVQTVSGGSHFAQKFDEASLEKARLALNELVEKAWVELDDKIFECKGFEDMNRGTYQQVVIDISRLIEQINDLERKEAEAIQGIAQKEQEIKDVEALLQQETLVYNKEYSINQAELMTRQNDLDVFQFILEFTQCDGATSLAQTKTRVCEMRNGRKTLLFHDSGAASKYKKMLTARSKKTIDQILRSVEGKQTSFLQQPINDTSATPEPSGTTEVLGEDGKPCIGAAGQLPEGADSAAGVDTAGSGMGDEDACMKSCGPDPPDCALLHDKLSLMWGEYKDKVDELTMEMLKNELEFGEMKATLNNQIRMLVVAKARFMELLAEVRANLAADRAEMKEKYTQKGRLDHQYYTFMSACKARIQWIMYQDMCAIKVVRNAVLENSTECPAAQIQDCDMDSWVKNKCPVACDDTCTPSDPYSCGGWAEMTRGIVQENDACGIQCPVQSKYIRCNQIKCPVNCEMSEWSGWSKCTAECEGGLRGRTRSVLVKPLNGGESCNTNEDSEACNTESCDRDCSLQAWTSWTPCSAACDGGNQERFRHVLIPTRGQGKCPTPKSWGVRYEQQQCNTHKCVGDEICIAHQDLVIGVDGSGSLQESGFEILKKYTTVLIDRYQTEYFGVDAMKIGIVLFGNGIIMPDGKTVSPAINSQTLTADLATVKTVVENLPFKKGFTNMAQAWVMAEDQFTKYARKDAQQSVLLITDGRPSFNFMTNEMKEQLEDKNIMRYFVVVNDLGPNSDEMKQMKAWASQPWQSNLIHVQGLLMLEADMDLWAKEALVKFCPMAHSPSAVQQRDEIYGFQHVKDSGWCGTKSAEPLSRTIESADECAALASGANAEAFVVGAFFRRGWCLTVSGLTVDETTYDGWSANKANPSCSLGWTSSMLYDYYAMKPLATSF